MEWPNGPDVGTLKENRGTCKHSSLAHTVCTNAPLTAGIYQKGDGCVEGLCGEKSVGIDVVHRTIRRFLTPK